MQDLTYKYSEAKVFLLPRKSYGAFIVIFNPTLDKWQLEADWLL